MILRGAQEKARNSEMPVKALTFEWLTSKFSNYEGEFELICSSMSIEGEIEKWGEYGWQITKKGVSALADEKYLKLGKDNKIRNFQLWQSKGFWLILIASIILTAIITRWIEST